MVLRALTVLVGGTLLANALASPATMREVQGVSFPTKVEMPRGEMPLRGAGTLRYGLFFKVYVAALYAHPGPARDLLQAGTSRRLEIEYFVDIDAERIAALAERQLRGQLSDVAWQRLAPRVQAWHLHFRDVRAGDRYAMQYSDRSLTLSLNGELVASVPDPELAAAYFGLWLGDQPIDADLRRALLGSGSDPDG